MIRLPPRFRYRGHTFPRIRGDDPYGVLFPSWREDHFPRIRGDDPCLPATSSVLDRFSPYSRGWSLVSAFNGEDAGIFPVFAGMVPARHGDITIDRNFPRIRGDGPELMEVMGIKSKFSPYSRGWSLPDRWFLITQRIFPVFAGMVLPVLRVAIHAAHFPRIRGDGP